MNEQEKRLYERSVTALEKIAKELPRLSRDVQNLVNRIEPFEDDRRISDSSYERPKPKNFREVLDLFEKARQDIENAEHTIQRMGARIDQIHNDSWSRDDLKPWIK